KVSIYGDFRFRYEYRDRDWKADSDSDRFRIRARVGLKARINEEFLFDVRFATSEFFEDGGDTVGGDYVSGNKTLGDYWASKNAWIDRAYVAYTPNWNKELKILAGKTYNPFYLPGKSDLVWDHDLNPEGVGLQYGTDLTEADALFANAFAGIVQENGSDSDKRMLGGQVGIAHRFSDENTLTVGTGYYDYSNVKGEESIVAGAFAGNSNDGTNYLYDYNMWEVFGEFATNIGNMPFSVFGDYVMNTASDVDDDTGWLLGFKVNKAKNPGTWQFVYNYRDLEKDATFGAFTDSDFADGGTNVKGHKFSFAYMLAKNTAVGATYFCNENNNYDDDGYERLQLDLKVKF
ncbi:MAG: putative porin, partial [Planctomycetota bacterium]